MSKRQRDIQIRQLASVAAATPAQPAIPPSRPSPSPALQSDAAESSPAAEGMNTFIDWITDLHNHERLYKNPISGQKQRGVRQEIANFVNNRHNTNWTEIQVKSKIAYMKAKYREATKLNLTSQGNVTAKQLEICPEFTRLHEVYGGSLAVNPPPPRQPVSFGDEPTVVEDTDEESSDLDATWDSPDINPHTNTQTDLGDEDVGPANKCRKYNLSEQQIKAYNGGRSELRQRELAIEQREKELTEKLLRLSEEASKRAEEARERLRPELAAERAQVRQELAAERAEFRKETADEKADERADERAEAKRERSEIIALKVENAALKRELEVRNYRPVNQ
ncbi:hypothetical protein BGX26_002215 [Mortierella sp. AD094]|nr:hypothetical protein BGX26_002215 [Mortierella sp. AD094]